MGGAGRRRARIPPPEPGDRRAPVGQQVPQCRRQRGLPSGPRRAAEGAATRRAGCRGLPEDARRTGGARQPGGEEAGREAGEGGEVRDCAVSERLKGAEGEKCRRLH